MSIGWDSEDMDAEMPFHDMVLLQVSHKVLRSTVHTASDIAASAPASAEGASPAAAEAALAATAVAELVEETLAADMSLFQKELSLFVHTGAGSDGSGGNSSADEIPAGSNYAGSNSSSNTGGLTAPVASSKAGADVVWPRRFSADRLPWPPASALATRRVLRSLAMQALAKNPGTSGWMLLAFCFSCWFLLMLECCRCGFRQAAMEESEEPKVARPPPLLQAGGSLYNVHEVTRRASERQQRQGGRKERSVCC